MKSFFLTVALFLPAVGNTGGAIVSGGFADKGIQVYFASLGAGSDLTTEKKLLSIIQYNLQKRSLRKITSLPEGFEGDITYCLEFSDFNVMSDSFDEINKLVQQGENTTGKTVTSCQ